MKLIYRSFFVVILLFLCDVFAVRGPSWFLEQIVGPRFLFNQALSLLVLWCVVIIAIRFCSTSFWARFVCGILAAVVFFLQAAHFGVYRELISSFAVIFFLQNPLLSLAAGIGELPWLNSLAAAFFSFAVVFWGLKSGHRPKKIIQIGAAVLGTTGLITAAVFWFSLPSHQNPLVAFAASCVDSVRVSGLKKMKFNRPDLPPQKPRPNPPNIVWIIGESLNWRSMGIYGYKRDTTPGLSALEKSGEVLKFTNVTTIGAHTMIAVPYMLAGLQGIDPYGLVFTKPTVFAYARSAGYRTAFISAQDTRWGNLETFLDLSHIDFFRSGSFFSSNVSVHKGADDYKVLNEGLLPFAMSTTKPYLAVMQMDGSHYPYSEHSPAQFKKFLPEESPNSVNAYDNTVLYSDSILTSLIRKIRATDPSAWIFFCSDHPDGVGGTEGGFHAPGGRYLTEVPFLVSPPKDSAQALSKAVDYPISQSDILPTILDIVGIEAKSGFDGFSLLSNFPKNRLRVVSGYMSTLAPTPMAQVIFPDKTKFFVDFQRKSAETSPGVNVPYESLPASVISLFADRLKEPIQAE